MIRVMVKSQFDGRYITCDAHTEEEAKDWLWKTCKMIQEDNKRMSFPSSVELNEWQVSHV
jgi:hypothetical protein